MLIGMFFLSGQPDAFSVDIKIEVRDVHEVEREDVYCISNRDEQLSFRKRHASSRNSLQDFFACL